MSEENNKEEEKNHEGNEEETSHEEKQELSLEEQLDKAKKDYLYLYADFENYRKKAFQERSELVKYSNENILRELLQIMDNFKLAISMDVTSENLKSFVDGVNMIARELENMTERFGVSKIVSEGKFDPNLHEAISTEASNGNEDGDILKVYKEGYKLHDRLLRPAQVVIASEEAKEN